ncbi:ankyrin repeat domain-containing protein 39 isoform X2 [Oryctolagus cuniculus]|uniref:ankyrin repeat domain-containing protein 39 isoform X2 n=1 Tax=Oryctolagus cuniculus TaxID=9986 RepID=UPI0022307E2E|nr:ankyrin repeat domain-containing protein 39 isoform X2 [Oryctolagus cuniculus]
MAAPRPCVDGPCCSRPSAVPGVQQTLEEMDFERGGRDSATEAITASSQGLYQPEAGMGSWSQDATQHYASRNGHYAVCQFLLESGAKCDAQTHGGATALHRASYCGHTEIARLLLSHGCNPRLVDDDGMTSLHKAAEKGHVDICSLLLQHSPALKAVRDRKARLACDLLPSHSDLRDLLAA